MIGKPLPFGKGFLGLSRYLEKGAAGEERDRVEWVETRNLPTEDPETAARLMAAYARECVRTQRPVYHLVISADPGDPVDRASMSRVAVTVLRELGLSEHQVLIIAHNDTAHPHMHLVVNRVHPETHRAWENGWDWPKIEKALSAEEEALGWRVVPRKARREPSVPALVRGDAAFLRTVQERGGPVLGRAASWAELEEGLAAVGLHVRIKGGGLSINDGRQEVKASEVDRSFSRRYMEERLGKLSEYRRSRPAAPVAEVRAPEPELPVSTPPAPELEQAPEQEPEPLAPPALAPVQPHSPEVPVPVRGVAPPVARVQARAPEPVRPAAREPEAAPALEPVQPPAPEPQPVREPEPPVARVQPPAPEPQPVRAPEPPVARVQPAAPEPQPVREPEPPVARVQPRTPERQPIHTPEPVRPAAPPPPEKAAPPPAHLSPGERFTWILTREDGRLVPRYEEDLIQQGAGMILEARAVNERTRVRTACEGASHDAADNLAHMEAQRSKAKDDAAALGRKLAPIYSEPGKAGGAMDRHEREHGMDDVRRMLRERPEAFGALVPERRALGLWTSTARAAKRAKNADVADALEKALRSHRQQPGTAALKTARERASEASGALIRAAEACRNLPAPGVLEHRAEQAFRPLLRDGRSVAWLSQQLARFLPPDDREAAEIAEKVLRSAIFRISREREGPSRGMDF
ncbi:relaxase/mobilization nuclease domain-containing protein [Longimicrobium sp.]|uniref:relaxase/mobilization nuclease domain-containing protein n=1 Tax=Longimicrobium sp. TaxID=2029185 RepID=UPI003B3B0F18